MADSPVHRIQKQYLKLTLDTEKDAFKHQQAFRTAFYDKVLPAFEEVLNQFSKEGITIRLDQIHLDLGEIYLEEVEEYFVQEASRALAEQLGILISKAEKGKEPGVEIIPQAISDLDLLIGFFKQGRLPWWSGKQGVNPRKVLEEQLEKQPEVLMERLIREPMDRIMVRRLVHQFAPELVLKVLAAIPAPETRLLLSLFKTIQEIHDHPNTVLPWPQKLGLEVFTVYLLIKIEPSGKPPPAITPAQEARALRVFSEYFFPELAKKTGKSIVEILNTLKKAVKKWESPGGIAHSHPLMRLIEISSEKPSQIPSPTEDNFQKRPVPPQPSEVVPDPEEASPGGTESTLSETSIPPTQDSESSKGSKWRLWEEEEIYIDNAGLVIVGGFLEVFFQNLGILEEQQFKNQEKQVRAIYLLQYLVTGKQALLPPEEDLPLNKFLCGYPLSQPLPELSSPFSAKELSEAEDLLRSVIEYWEVLGKISVDDLRQAFLVREGKLIYTGTGWILKVDRQTLDVLLENIPWTVGRIEHPWMEKGLEVDW